MRRNRSEGAPYYCEICGAPVYVPKYYEVDGAIMILCQKCAKYGKPIKKPFVARSRLPMTRKQSVQTEKRIRKKSFDDGLELPELVEDYGGVIKRAREKKGWTQEQLARALGESVSFIRKIENQKVIPPDYLIKRLEKLLGIKLTKEYDEAFSIDWDADKKTDDFVTLGDILIIKKPRKSKKSKK